MLVDVSGTITPLLTQFFDPNLTLPIRAGAAARVNPLNVMLAMDNSSYMSPSYVVGAQYWGNLGQHPASVLFQNSAGPGKILIDPNLHSYSNIDATLTQQCFSPPQLALKQATLGIYQYLVGISLNSVGLMFYPGRTPDPASTTPTLTRDPFIARSVNSTDTIQSNGEAAFEDYTSAAPRHSRDVHCAAIASHSPSASSPYTLPLPRTGLHRATLNQQGNFPINFVSQDQYFYWHYNKNYAQYLTAREVIWSRASQGMTGVLELSLIHI